MKALVTLILFFLPLAANAHGLLQPLTATQDPLSEAGKVTTRIHFTTLSCDPLPDEAFNVAILAPYPGQSIRRFYIQVGPSNGACNGEDMVEREYTVRTDEILAGETLLALDVGKAITLVVGQTIDFPIPRH